MRIRSIVKWIQKDSPWHRRSAAGSLPHALRLDVSVEGHARVRLVPRVETELAGEDREVNVKDRDFHTATRCEIALVDPPPKNKGLNSLISAPGRMAVQKRALP